MIFHIGLEKTGTTSFQRFCFEHRDALLASGVLYPRYRAHIAINHKVFAASYLPKKDRDFSVAILLPSRAHAVRAIRREIAKCQPRIVLISAEHLSSRFDETCARRLAADFADYDCRIVVAVRDVHARFLSAYSISIISGRDETLDAYADEVLDPQNPYLRLPQTLAPWRRAFGDDRIILVDYDNAGPDIVDTLLSACGVGPVDYRKKTNYRESPSMSLEGLLTLRLCNAMLRERQDKMIPRPFPLWAQHIYFSRACRRKILKERPDERGGEWALSAAQLARLDHIAEAERDFLQATFGLAKTRPANRRPITIAAGPEPDDCGRLHRSSALVQTVTGFRWAISQALVRATLAVRACYRFRRPG